MYSDLVEAQRALDIPLAEYAWDSRPDTDYIVIAIDQEAGFYADGHMENQSPQGTIDLFSRNNDRETMQRIQETLNGFDGCAWYLNSVQYEQETRLLHWEWVFSLETW